jgi:hypothetical protein
MELATPPGHAARALLFQCSCAECVSISAEAPLLQEALLWSPAFRSLSLPRRDCQIRPKHRTPWTTYPMQCCTDTNSAEGNLHTKRFAHLGLITSNGGS